MAHRCRTRRWNTRPRRLKHNTYGDEAALTTFIAENRIDDLNRQIEEKQQIIASLQSGRQTALKTVIDEQMKAQSQIIAAYISAQADNRLLAFNKEQQGKRELLSSYIEEELDSRLTVFRSDRSVRNKLFDWYVGAGVESLMAVFDEQLREKTGDLAESYATKGKIQRLLQDTQAMRDQIASGGDAAAGSSNLAILLLKAQAFASSGALPASLQLQLEAPTDAAVTSKEQLADLDAMEVALQARLSELEAAIDEQSRELLAGTGYQFLDHLSASELGVSSPTSGTTVAGEPEGLSTLSAFVAEKWAELFDVGSLAESAQGVAVDTALFANIRKLYPELFVIGNLAELSQEVASDNPLAVAASSKVADLLQLEGMEAVISYTVETEALTEAISKLQDSVRELLAEVARESARNQELTRARDLAWDSYTMLARKTVELDITAQTAGCEVRFASPAVEPRGPVSPNKMQNTAIAGALGLMIGLFGAFAIEYFAGPHTHPGN